MGKVVRKVVKQDAATEIVAGVDTAMEGDGFTFPSFTEIAHCDMPADVVVDFSGVSAIHSLLEYGMAKHIPLVICTTGFPAEINDEIQTVSKKIAIFQSANMSLGINLLKNMLTRAAKLLYDAKFDVEIVERHHNQKLDAPSGTALMLAESVNQALGGNMRVVNDRGAARAKRGRDEIGLHALRGGTIVGEHAIVFAGQDEVVEFSHAAYSRDVFAVGAVKAAQFIKGKPPGLYTMQDLIDAL
jgi:4-hydroxy-tetrahydrodipicolinate reductase